MTPRTPRRPVIVPPSGSRERSLRGARSTKAFWLEKRLQTRQALKSPLIAAASPPAAPPPCSRPILPGLAEMQARAILREERAAEVQLLAECRLLLGDEPHRPRVYVALGGFHIGAPPLERNS